jgi:hypothetical protein
MKYSLLLMLLYMSAFISCASSCINEEVNIDRENNVTMENGKIKITVNSQSFTATLLDNNSAKAFMEMLPMTINMTELNRNEKYFDLPSSLPINSSNPGTIRNGDLMLYGSNTLVLFYKSFSTSYSYTKIGSIDNPNGLEEALGAGNVSVTYNIDLD